MFSGEDVITSGQSRSFHEYNAVSTVNAANEGAVSGSMIVKKILSAPAPSSRAASSNSLGTEMKACLSKKVPNAEKIPGSEIAGIESNRWRSLTRVNCAIRNSWLGAMSMTRNNPKSRPLPGKRNRANPYAASEQTVT